MSKSKLIVHEDTKYRYRLGWNFEPDEDDEIGLWYRRDEFELKPLQ